ncbi:unnamed protein product, partial [Urochloa humidicola]
DHTPPAATTLHRWCSCSAAHRSTARAGRCWCSSAAALPCTRTPRGEGRRRGEHGSREKEGHRGGSPAAVLERGRPLFAGIRAPPRVRSEIPRGLLGDERRAAQRARFGPTQLDPRAAAPVLELRLERELCRPLRLALEEARSSAWRRAGGGECRRDPNGATALDPRAPSARELKRPAARELELGARSVRSTPRAREGRRSGGTPGTGARQPERAPCAVLQLRAGAWL